MEDGEDLFLEVGDDLSDDGEPSVDVAFEGKHVGRAGAFTAFAGDFPCDALGEEVLEEGVGEVVDAGFPDFGAICVVVHESRSLQQNGGVVRESGLVDVGAVLLDVSTIIHPPVLMVDVLYSPKPIPSLFSILRIGRVTSVSRKSSSNVEEASVGNG